MRLRRRSFSVFAFLAALPLRGAARDYPDATVTTNVIRLAAYELFPHDSLAGDIYETLAQSFIDADLDRAAELASALGSHEFLDVSRPLRIERMLAQQSRADFQALRMHVLMGLYTNLEVTRHFGYEGPSYAQGGYLERGFDDIRWVPEPDIDAH